MKKSPLGQQPRASLRPHIHHDAEGKIIDRHHPSGKINQRLSTALGRLHDPSLTYDQQRNVRQSLNFENGLLHGPLWICIKRELSWHRSPLNAEKSKVELNFLIAAVIYLWNVITLTTKGMA